MTLSLTLSEETCYVAVMTNFFSFTKKIKNHYSLLFPIVITNFIHCSSPPLATQPEPDKLFDFPSLPASVLPQTRTSTFPQINRSPVCDDKGLCFQNPQIPFPLAHPFPLAQKQETIFANGSDDFWFFPQGPHSFHFDGIEWKWIQVPTQSSIRAVWGEHPTMDRARNIWTLSEDGQVFRLGDNSWKSIGILRPPLSIPLPSYGNTDADFHYLQALSKSDLWAGGRYQDVEGLYHFDGVTWSFFGANQLGIHEISKTWGMWASDKHLWVMLLARETKNADEEWILFVWDGATWKKENDPTITGIKYPDWLPAQGGESLTGNSDTDVFLAGTKSIHHYDGTSWSLLTKDFPITPYIQTVRADHAKGFWISTKIDFLNTQSWHFDGTNWKNQLGGVQVDQFLASTTSQDAWFLGKHDPNQPERTLFYFDGSTLYTHATDIFAAFDETYGSAAQSSMSINTTFSSDEKNVWALGTANKPAETRIVKWNSDGTYEMFKTSLVLNAGWSNGPKDVWVGGQAFSLLHFDGSTWMDGKIQSKRTNFSQTGDRLQEFSGGIITSIWGSAENDIWAVGLRGEILHYDGQIWIEVQESGQLYDLYKVWGLNKDHVWAVGSKGTVLFFDGHTWAADPLFAQAGNDRYSFYGFQAIQYPNSTFFDFFLSGREAYDQIAPDSFGKPALQTFSRPLLLKSISCSNTCHWSSLEIPYVSSSFSATAQVIAKSSNDFWVVNTDDGTLYHYNYTQPTQNPVIWPNLGALSLSSTAQGVWIGGQNGTVLFSK